jgi:hypothetical protein
MVVANYSMFFGLRSEIRKVVLGRLMPDLPRLTLRLTTVGAPPIADEALRTITRERVSVVRNECATYGAKLVLALPPTPAYHELTVVRDAAAESGVETVLPFSADDFAATDYSDGFHLNASGAAKFTDKFIQALPGFVSVN